MADVEDDEPIALCDEGTGSKDGGERRLALPPADSFPVLGSSATIAIGWWYL